MRFSAKTIYAIRAVLELAKQKRLGKTVLTLNDLSESCDIPVNFLVAVLASLRKVEIVESIRGKEGGYRLMKSPESVSVGDVVRATQSPDSPATRRVVDSAKTMEQAFIEDMRNSAEAGAFAVLDGISLAQAADTVSGKQSGMYYI